MTIANAMPQLSAPPSLAMITRSRFGVVRKVGVAVWWKNSLVTTRMPMIIASSRPKYWPEVKTFDAR